MMKRSRVENAGLSLSRSLHILSQFYTYYPRGENMDKDKMEQQAQKQSNEIFNSITEKVKPENQNQTHNSRREGMGPNTKRKPS